MKGWAALTLVSVGAAIACCGGRNPAPVPHPLVATSSTVVAATCPPEVTLPIEQLIFAGELRAAAKRAADANPPCERELRRLRADALAALGEVDAVRKLLADASEEQRPVLADALERARALAKDDFDSLLSRGLAARSKGRRVEGRALLDRAYARAERDAPGDHVHAVAIDTGAYIQFSARQKYVSYGSFTYEIRTGRLHYLPNLLALSPDERRALSWGATSLATGKTAAESDHNYATLVELDTDKRLFEDEVSADSYSFDDALTTFALPAVASLPLLSLREGSLDRVVLAGTPIAIDKVMRCSGVFGLCPHGGAYVLPDGSRMVRVTEGKGGNVVHLRVRGGTEYELGVPGATVRALALGKDPATIGISWSDDTVRIYDAKGLRATYTKIETYAFGMTDDGKKLTWVGGDKVMAELSPGKRVGLPLHSMGCAGPSEMVIAGSNVTTYEESGDITCAGYYNFATKKTGGATLSSPGDSYQAEQDELAIAKKIGHGVKPPLLRRGKEVMALRDGAAVIFDAKSGKELRKLEGGLPCALETSRWAGDVIACVSADQGVVMFDATSGKRVLSLVSPPPASPVPSADAEKFLRCALGSKLYPLALCESDARDDGLLKD